MKDLRLGVIGAGFWASYQLAAWNELAGVQCIAICDCVRSKAESLADRFGVANVYEDSEELVSRAEIDFVDIITDVSTHHPLVTLAARHKKPVICQKPLSDTYELAANMVQVCQQAQAPLLVHENWRWQAPIRGLNEVIASGRIGRVFRARIQYSNSFPVFANQPALKESPRFILNDVGVHILDAARFLFGEARRIYCQTSRVCPDIQGEDVATIMLETERGTSITCELSYATRWGQERFPQTFFFVEGSQGSVELGPDFRVTTTTAAGTSTEVMAPPDYAWTDPAYEVVHASMVPCLANLLGDLRGEGQAETTGADNLRTLRLVELAYESAATGKSMIVN